MKRAFDKGWKSWFVKGQPKEEVSYSDLDIKVPREECGTTSIRDKSFSWKDYRTGRKG